jgi:hypothetical protein
MGRPDVEVLRARHDQYGGPPAANVVLRALALPLGELALLVAPGGQLLVLGRRPLGDADQMGAPQPLADGAWVYSRS